MLIQLIVLLSLMFGAQARDMLLYGLGPHPRSPRYAIGFTNQTAGELREVRAEWSSNGITYSPSAGILEPGSEKVDNDAPDPIPPEVTVIWRTAEGKEHRQNVTVAKEVPHVRWFSGTIYFHIIGDHAFMLPVEDSKE